MHVISTTEELADACAALAAHPYVTVDTEFLREQTFWPQLCLVQMAGPADELIVDPLADGIDLAPFFELMMATCTVKVFHAGTATLDGQVVTNGGRVLGVTALGDSISDAIQPTGHTATAHARI